MMMGMTMAVHVTSGTALSPTLVAPATAQQGGHAAEQDTTSGEVAYVTRPGGPPDSSSYMWAGYIVALVLYLGYIVLMVRRIARSKRQLTARGTGGDGSR